MPIHINLNPDLRQLRNVALEKINSERKESGKPELNFTGDQSKDQKVDPENKNPLKEEEVKEQDRQRRRVYKVLGAALFVAVAIPATTYLVNRLSELVKASKGLSDAFKG